MKTGRFSFEILVLSSAISATLFTARISAVENYSDWTYYKNGYINTKAGTGAGVTNGVGHIPVLVRLWSGNFDFSKALGDGSDIRFSDTNGTAIPYEIEYWNNTADSAAIWIRIDSAKGNDSICAFRIYYGNNLVTSQSNSKTVFDTGNGFMGVWHLGEDASGIGTAGLYHDATYLGNNGDDSISATGKDGVAGRGQQFNGTSDFIGNIQLGAAGASDWTTSAWVKTSALAAGMIVTNRRDPATVSNSLHCGWWAGAATNNGAAYFSNDGPSCEYGAVSSTNLTVTGNWHQVVGTVSASMATYKIYIDGVLEATGNITIGGPCYGRSSGSTGWWEIGKGDAWGGATCWNGYIDEVRMAKVARSDDWIKLSWAVEKPASQVITLGAENVNPVVYRIWDGGGTDGKWSTAANWSGDIVPDSAARVLFTSTSTKNCTLDMHGKAATIAFTGGYTGTLFFTSDTLTVWSTADFSLAASINAGTGVLCFVGSQNFTPKPGAALPTILRSGAGTTTLQSNGLITGALIVSGGTMSLGSGLAHSIGALSGGGGLNFGSSTLTTASASVSLNTFSAMTAGSGALEFNSGSLQLFEPNLSATNPAILHSGTGTLRLSNRGLSAVSFSQTAGTVDLNGWNIQTSGDFNASGGTASFSNLAGRKITVGGNATFTGTSGNKINLNPAAYCTLSVTGNLNAVYASIAYNRAAVSTGYAASSDSSGPDINWVFDQEDYSTWAKKRNVFINTTASGSPIASMLTGYPALVRFSSADFPFNESQTDSGLDIRFSSVNGAHLSYEREWWDSLGGNAVLWVLVPQVTPGIKTAKFTMYWGKSSAANKSASSAVFRTSDNFQGVWHLTEDQAGAAGGALYKDATANAITGNDYVSATGKTGVIGRGQEFSAASSDHIDLPDFISTNWNAITIEGWANAKSPLQTDERAIMRKEVQFELALNQPSTGRIRNLVGTNGTTGWTVANDEVVTMSAGTWYYFAFTYDNAISALKHFFNGVQVGTSKTVTGTITDNANRVCIGSNSDGTTLNFNAFIDEVRISSIARTADWLRFTYDNEKAGSAVVHHYGPVVSGPGDTVLVAAFQNDTDTVWINYKVEDPNAQTPTIAAQYKVASGGWGTALTNTTGNIGGVDTSGTTTRRIRWSAADQLGAVEGYYTVRVIASDGTWFDTTESASFAIDTRAPTGLGSFACPDTASSSVTLSWSAATDVDFDHYEIWYGTNETKVQNRNTAGADGAQKWDNNSQANLTAASTTTATIPVLTAGTTYYFKIWAVDKIGNKSTVSDISVATLNLVTPVWGLSFPGAISGGSITESALYIGAADAKIRSLALSDGGTRWTYTSSNGVPNAPTYNYYGSSYKVFASAGKYLIGLQDNGSGYAELFSPVAHADSCGNPYASPDDSSLYVVYADSLVRRKTTTGIKIAGWPQYIQHASRKADIAVFNDEVYAATTDGKIYALDADGTPIAVSTAFAGSPSIALPLLVRSNTIYVTPNTSKVYALNASNLNQLWNVNLQAANTGPTFTSGEGVLYVACGNYVQRITLSGTPTVTDWSYNAGAAVSSGPINAFGTTVYFGRNSGQYFAITDNTTSAATVTNWPYSSAIIGNANTGPWIDETNSRVIFGTDGGYLHSFILH